MANLPLESPILQVGGRLRELAGGLYTGCRPRLGVPTYCLIVKTMPIPAFRYTVHPFLAVILALAMLVPSPASAADTPAAAPIDINHLMSDTQISSGGGRTVDLVWWVPEEFWTASFQDDTSMTEAQKQSFVKMLRPYTLVAVVRGTIGDFGTITYLDEKDIRAGLRLIGTDGSSYEPIDEEKASDEAKLLLHIIQPILANAAGKLGENMRFYLFPSQNKAGKRIADPRQPGMLTVMNMGTEIKYRLPLGSLLQPKFDSATGEQFPGNYQFNPYTGTGLTTTRPANKPANQ
jgi:hypothetical protein